MSYVLLIIYQQCITQPTLHPKYYYLMYYPFAVNLNRCMGSCNSLNDLFNKVCVPNKTKDLNLSAFNMTAGINESKIFKFIINKVSDNLFETLLHLIALLNL